MPSTIAAASSASTLCGTSQHSRRAPSSRARPSDRRGRDPRALGVEVVARAEPDERSSACRRRARPRGGGARPSPRRRRRGPGGRRRRRARSPRPRRPRGRRCRRRCPRAARWLTHVHVGGNLARIHCIAPAAIDPGDDSSCPRPSSSAPPAPRSARWAAASSSLDATELGGIAIKAALERADVAPEQVQHVDHGPGPAGRRRARSPRARRRSRPGSRRRSPRRRSTRSAPRACARSGILDAAIRAGDLEVGVGGGMESMSQAPYLLPKARFGFRMGDVKALDAMVHDGLTQPVQRQADVRRGDRGRRRSSR